MCGINVFDLSVNSQSESNYTAIMVLLFLMKLMEAYEDGIYKEYVRKRYNEYDFKGVMDINRHIKINNPFVGKTAYSTREYSYDNDILCLIRQTLDYIKDYFPDILKGYLNNNVILNEIIDAIENATPSYRMNVNYADSMKCRREITHPMYQKYEDVRKLALMILQESGQNVFDDKEEDTFGILIDISWLWEEFIAVKLLNEYGYLHMLTDNSKGSLQWAKGKPWYPDYIENGKADFKRNIFDAKYKFWDWNNDDIHQLLSYLFLTGGDTCGIIYPSLKEQSPKPNPREINAFASFYNTKPKIYALPLFIPQGEYDDYSEYCKKIDISIQAWKQSFSAHIATS